jgi:tripartite-type tricarboxylate transporter receptor subunit TctC
MRTLTACIGRLACVAAAALAITPAAAEYPTRPIRLIVPSAPGGSPDIYARLIATELNKQMGQQLVVDNRPGGNSIIGFEAIAKAPADGYTVGYAIFPFILHPSVYAQLPYDTVKDFQPLVWWGSGTSLLTVTPALPVQSVRQLIDYARAQPGKLSYGAIGIATSQALAIELLKFMTGTQIVLVSYKGMQQAITDAIAGQIHVICDSTVSILPHIRAGRMRVIGITTLQRLAILPDIPTIAESGLPGFEIMTTAGFVMPARTPRDIVMRLNAEMNKALQSKPVSENALASGSVIGGGTPEQYAERLQRETVKWAGVIKAAGIKPQ